jgi:signal transduction histidine kinase
MSSRRGLSLQHKLPLLIGTLFLVLAAGGSYLAYGQVRDFALESSTERLERVSRQLAELVDDAVVARLTRMEEAASDSSVVAILEGATPAGEDEVPGVLRALAAMEGTELVEVWTPSGDPLFTIGFRQVGWSAAQMDSLRNLTRIPEGGGYSEIVSVRNERYVWAVHAVERDEEVIGSVAQLRPVDANPTSGAIRDLIGPGTRIYFANESGGPWVTLGGDLIPAHLQAPPFTPQTYFDPDAREFLAHANKVQSGGFSIIAALPMAEVLAPARVLGARFAGGAVVLLLLGALGGWFISRRITIPLQALNRAARDLAAGRYSSPLSLDRGDELGELAGAFDSMAADVQTAQEELRARYEKLRGMTKAIEENRRALAASAREIREAYVAEEEANRAKSDFVAMLSHEVRTPISAIIGYTELLEVGIPGELNAEQRAHIERIGTNARQVSTMLDELLDLAKVESGQLLVASEVEGVNVVVKDALSTVAPEANRKGIRIEWTTDTDPEMEFRGDPKRVRQILLNLLSNAIKFSDDGAVVEVRTASEADGEGPARWCGIRVRDTGVGIRPDEIERIFEPFVQGASAAEGGGVGLGLAISRRLARLMGGEIEVSSEPGTGSTFTLRLPSPKEDARANRPRPRKAWPAPKRSRQASDVPQRSKPARPDPPA